VNVRCNLGFLKHLIQDTFRQAVASGIFGMMLVVTAICVVFCLSVDVSGDVALHSDSEPVFFLPQPQDHAIVPSAGASQAVRLPLETDPALARREGIETINGRMTMEFGAVSFPVSRERSDAVHFLQLILASGIAGTFGLLLTLVWTAGFVPTFLDPSAASVLLAKPIPRWQLLLGKYFGVLAFVGFQSDPVQCLERERAFREAVGLQTRRVRTRVLTATVDPLFTRDDRRVAGFVYPRVQNGGLLIDLWRDERIGISRFFQASQGSGRATSESARGPRRSAQNRSMPNRAHFSQTELTPRGS